MTIQIHSLNLQFSEHFSSLATHYSFAPGRINLIGEHIDYMGGLVVPAAIDKGITILGKPDSNSDTLKVYAADIGQSIELKIENLQNQQPEGWQAYLYGALKETIANQNPFWTGSLMIRGDLPQGAGLSSSAALEVALLKFFFAEASKTISNKDLALMAQRVENIQVGTQCGIMDQYASVHGKENHFMTLDCNRLKHKYHSFDHSDQISLILINSMVSHKLGNQYNEIRKDLETAENVMDNGPLINQDSTNLERHNKQLTTEQFSRASYVIDESARVSQFCNVFSSGDFKQSGQLLQKTHQGLSKQLKVSTIELDCLIDISKNIQGWYGGRMMGGGFGGCTLNLVDKKFEKGYRNKVQEIFMQKFKICPEVYEVKLGAGAFTQSIENS